MEYVKLFNVMKMFCFVCLCKGTEIVFMCCVVKEWGWLSLVCSGDVTISLYLPYKIEYNPYIYSEAWNFKEIILGQISLLLCSKTHLEKKKSGGLISYLETRSTVTWHLRCEINRLSNFVICLFAV
jgi:hypothetical protein